MIKNLNLNAKKNKLNLFYNRKAILFYIYFQKNKIILNIL